MKTTKVLPVFAALLYSISGFSQSYHSIVQADSKWINTISEYEYKDGYNKAQENLLATDAYCIQGEDSLIAGKLHAKVDDCAGNYVGGILDEAGKVFFVTKGSSTQRLIYDFTVQAGDTVKNVLIKDKNSPFSYNIHTVVVQSVDSVELYGEMRKRINFANASWVEGIGNTQGFLTGHYARDSKNNFELQCMSVGNTSLFPDAQGGHCELPAKLRVDTRKITELIYPSVANDKFVMEFNRRVDQDEIYIITEDGKMIQPAMNVEPAKIEVDLSSYSSGKYMVLMRNDNKLSLGRMVKI